MRQAATALLLTVLGAFTIVLSPTAVARDQLIIGVTQFPPSLHPNIDSTLAKSYVLGMAQRPITAFDHDWQLICMLCTELPSLENGGAKLETTANGGDGVAVTYTLQPDAKWGDGTPVSTADVMFTYEVGRTEAVGIGNQEMYRRILSIDVHDEKSFTLHQDRVTFDYQAINDFRLLPAHLERPIFEQSAAEYGKRSLYVTDPVNDGLYFGPYRIAKVESGAFIALETNPTWWGEPPAFKKIIVRTIEDTATLEANLLSDEVDTVAGELGFSIEQALAFEKRNGDRFKVLYKPGLIYEHMDVMLENPILSDVRVRQALLYGIDRGAISHQLFEGKQKVADTNVHPLDWVHSAEVPSYAFDAARAGTLLDQAGWSEMKSGVRHNAAGEKLSLELMTTAGNRTRELVQQVLQSQWKAIGVDIKIRNEPPRVYFGETLRKRKFTGLALFAWVSSPENVPRTALHSGEIPNEGNGWSGQNLTGYQNPEMDRLIDAIELELDREKRQKMWVQIQRIYATELPVLPLYFRSDPHVMPKWLQGVRPTGHLNPSTLWVEQWHSS